MKKIKNRSGYSLIEALAAIAVLTIMIVGMGSGLTAGVNAYKDAVFYANSRTMADIVSTSISDVLRYGDLIRICPETGFKCEDGSIVNKEKTGFVISNYEYHVINGYFEIMPASDGTNRDLIWIKDLQNSAPALLVNTGAYPRLELANLKITYEKDKSYFDVSFDIQDIKDSNKKHEVQTTVRLLNAQNDHVLLANPGTIPGGGSIGGNGTHGGNGNGGNSSGDGGSDNTEVHVHKYVTKIVPPTCTTDGYTLHICSCGDQYKSDAVPAAHKYKVESVKAATCTEPEMTHYVCSVCQKAEKTEQTAKALGHELKNGKVVIVAPTCKEQGYTRHYCSRCKTYFEDTDFVDVDPNAHKWGEWKVTQKPTTKKEGKETRICSLCNKKETRSLPKLKPSGPDLSAYNEWDRATKYEKGDIVQYDNKLYVAKRQVTQKNPSDSEYWIQCELWNPNVEYTKDDVVVYNRKAYKFMVWWSPSKKEPDKGLPWKEYK